MIGAKGIFLSLLGAIFFINFAYGVNMQEQIPDNAYGCYGVTTQSECGTYSGCQWYSDSVGNAVCFPKCVSNECVGYGTDQCVHALGGLGTQNYTCITCGGDTPYATETHLGCVACDGDLQYIDSGVCKTCPDNKMANSGHTACNGGCAPGYECSGSNCANCNACSPGYKCVGGTQAKQICPKGTFAGNGQSSCTLCPLKYTTNSTGATGPEECVLAPVKLTVGNVSVTLPNCLKTGTENNSVIRVVNN